MTKKNNRFSGFSLVEVMLVITLTSAIMLVLYRVYSALSSGSQRLKIQNEQRESIMKALNIMYNDFTYIKTCNNINQLYITYIEYQEKNKNHKSKPEPQAQSTSTQEDKKNKVDDDKKKLEELKNYVKLMIPSGIETEKEYQITLPTNRLLLEQKCNGNFKVIYSYEKNKDKTYTLYRTEKSEDDDNAKKYKLLDHISKVSIEWYVPEVDFKTTKTNSSSQKKEDRDDNLKLKKTLENWYKNPSVKKIKTYEPLKDEIDQAPLMPVCLYIQAEVKKHEDFGSEVSEFLYTFPSFYLSLAQHITALLTLEKVNPKKEAVESEKGNSDKTLTSSNTNTPSETSSGEQK